MMMRSKKPLAKLGSRRNGMLELSEWFLDLKSVLNCEFAGQQPYFADNAPTPRLWQE